MVKNQIKLIKIKKNKKLEKEMKDSVGKCINALKNFSEILGLKLIGSVVAINGDAKSKEKELILLGKKISMSG